LIVAVLLLVMAALQPISAQAGGAKSAPVPTKLGAGDVSVMYTGSVGDIYVGATPPNVDYSKPVLVFIHGYNSSADTWWTETTYHGVNDMYQYAYNNGYRTAFVNVAPDLSMWYNGSLFNSQIDVIRNYFGVSKVTVIAHSKGGVDANAASVHYGASSKISRIITLSSPHWGTPLADMAFSSWTWWLAALFGQTNEATYVLQTGYMNYYRSITPTDTIPYYTFSGYKCGPVFSAMWYGCMAISGEDDGVVPVWSTRIPGGTHIKEGYWDHDEIKMGSRTWSYFFPYIQTASAGTQAVALQGALLAAAPGRQPDVGFGGTSGSDSAPAGNLILRGGATGTAAAPDFPVESGVRSATFSFIASGPGYTATLTGPDGTTYTVAATDRVPGDQVFAGAYTGAVTVTAPAAGRWSVTGAAPGQTGWLMVGSLDSDLQVNLDTDAAVATPGARKALAVGITGRTPASVKAEAAVSKAGEKPFAHVAFTPAASGKQQAMVTVPQGNAIHNVTVTVTGTLPDGTAFERTAVSSFAAVAPADRGVWKGR
jgi:pimeloyl-ACP methyl ester carboxylesterase